MNLYFLRQHALFFGVVLVFVVLVGAPGKLSRHAFCLLHTGARRYKNIIRCDTGCCVSIRLGGFLVFLLSCLAKFVTTLISCYTWVSRAARKGEKLSRARTRAVGWVVGRTVLREEHTLGTQQQQQQQSAFFVCSAFSPVGVPRYGGGLPKQHDRLVGGLRVMPSRLCVYFPGRANRF